MIYLFSISLVIFCVISLILYYVRESIPILNNEVWLKRYDYVWYGAAVPAAFLSVYSIVLSSNRALEAQMMEEFVKEVSLINEAVKITNHKCDFLQRRLPLSSRPGDSCELARRASTYLDEAINQYPDQRPPEEGPASPYSEEGGKSRWSEWFNVLRELDKEITLAYDKSLNAQIRELTKKYNITENSNKIFENIWISPSDSLKIDGNKYHLFDKKITKKFENKIQAIEEIENSYISEWFENIINKYVYLLSIFIPLRLLKSGCEISIKLRKLNE